MIGSPRAIASPVAATDPPIDTDSVDHRYCESTRFDVLDRALLLQRAPLRKRLEDRFPDLRLLQLTVRDLEIEFLQVATVQTPYQVSRTEIECCPDLLHFLPRVSLSAESSIGSVPSWTIMPISRALPPGLHSK
jgi:hypothetical protein